MSLLRSKGIHLKLDKPTHASFKTRLIHHELTMQEALAEFARLVGIGNPSAVRILERLAMTKIKAELAEVGLKRTGTRQRVGHLDELDHETLYDLINEDDNADEIAPREGGHGEAA